MKNEFLQEGRKAMAWKRISTVSRTSVTMGTARILEWVSGPRMEPIDERGGGRNTDESFHISGGAVIAGMIATGVGVFVANKLGVLK